MYYFILSCLTKERFIGKRWRPRKDQWLTSKDGAHDCREDIKTCYFNFYTVSKGFEKLSENANCVLALGHSCALKAHCVIKGLHLPNEGKCTDVLTFYFTLAAERIHLLNELKS